MSAEMVTIGTLGVMGAVVGLNAASTAVDQELKEFAGAIRSLDQSYGYAGHQSCRAWSAGSYYRQVDVQTSLADLCANGDTDIKAIEKHVNQQRSAHLPPAPQPQPETETPVMEEEELTRPNQLPEPKLEREQKRPGKPQKKFRKLND